MTASCIRTFTARKFICAQILMFTVIASMSPELFLCQSQFLSLSNLKILHPVMPVPLVPQFVLKVGDLLTLADQEAYRLRNGFSELKVELTTDMALGV
jgi:hypothetical protein